jgi:hypothetical protein
MMKYKNITHYTKNKVIQKLVPDEISPCSLVSGSSDGVCSSDKALQLISSKYGVSGSRKEIVESAKQVSGCNDEKCVLQAVANLDPQLIRAELGQKFKIKGPTDTGLLSNTNIDNTLKQWATAFAGFFPYNFNMRNYKQYSFNNGVINSPDTLATISFVDLHQKGFKMAACVINSDVYQGPGKHWMALFVDGRANPATVEFFNSSGNSPVAEWCEWLVKTKYEMEKVGLPNPTIVKVTNIQHQQSDTECGVYSLFYIWSRLNGISHEYINTTPIPDQIMFEFRQHLFPSNLEKFVWNDYKQNTKIKWE